MRDYARPPHAALLALALLVFARPAFASEADENVKKNLAAVTKDVGAARENWTVLTTNGLTGAQCQGRHAVPATEVKQAYSQLRAQLLERLGEKRLAPLRAWVEETIPPQAPPPDPQLASCFPGPPVVGEETADARVNEISRAAQKIAHLSSLTIAVRFSTKPSDGARVLLHPLRYPALVVDEATPTAVKQLYRGIYLIKVAQAGFAPVTDQQIILLDADDTKVQCNLVAAQSAGSSVCGLQP